MAESEREQRRLAEKLSDWLNLTAVATLVALLLSVHNFYRSYFYVSQQLDVTVTEVSYTTNRGELYATVAFANSGNRDAAILRVEPALWRRREGQNPEWVPLVDQVPEIAPVVPRTPFVVRAGGVEVVSLSTQLQPELAEQALVATHGGAFLGVRVATMNSDGRLFRLEHPIARLSVDEAGRIRDANPLIHRSLPGFQQVQRTPPGDVTPPTAHTPFVWADPHYK